ncbi:MAG TPA: winged helix-turn-helix domain-containing protein [Candidatus Sulfotelmatobacter sp.]|nr:winged helix-turn-helix domain-containing protein [Candidatus Sulfotelmatobacter sp.]
MEEVPQTKIFRFGVFEADPQTGELRKQGRRVSLQGQPFGILLMLLEQPGQLVSRAQIRERLWPEGTFVDFDHSLNTAVNKIRDVLGDSASSPRFIETLARRGYRFIAPVQLDGEVPVAAIAPPVSIQEENSRPVPQTSREVVTKSSSLLTAPDEVPLAHHMVVRTLFVLLQLMYFCFYIISLARLHAIEEVLGAAVSRPVWVVVVLIVTAVIGIPVRLYLSSMVAFRAPGLREKFLRLFPWIFPLDELWALAPFLLLQQIGYGLALGFTAILLYAPFAERSLILMAAERPSHVARAES